MAKQELLTIGQAAQLMTRLGYQISVPTLRLRRREWLRGEKWGPEPILIGPRQLRYEQSDVIAATNKLLASATERAAARRRADKT